MAGKYDVNEWMELLFDDEFCLTDGDISEEGANMLTATEKKFI